MKVFISWSGERSRRVAELLRTWVESVIQAVEPWVSSSDIDRGSLWFTQIIDELSTTTHGIICLTRDNKEKPWILFEAGALAKGLNSSRIYTLLVDLTPDDIRDPLAQFNHTRPTEGEMFKLVSSIFASFKSFFKLLHDEEAEMKVLGRGSEKKFDTDGISRAFVRTKSTKVIEHERQITGTLWGITPIDNTFNFLSNNNITYTGKLVPTFGLEYRSQVNRSEFYQAGSRYSAHIVRRTTRREGGTPHEAFFLVSLSAPDNPALPDTAKWRKT